MRATEGSVKLLKVIRNPVTDHLPVGCRKVGTSFTGTKVADLKELVPSDEPIAIVIGAKAHGKVSMGKSELICVGLFCLHFFSSTVLQMLTFRVANKMMT